VGALDEFAGDVNGIIADINAQFSVLQEKKLALRDKGNALAAKWNEYLTAQAKAMQTADDALNRISNLPLSETSPAAPTSGALSTVPPKVTFNGER
jgi:chromosome condensin MukBEF ATPase and DNA-binding subunit MukB